MVKVKEITKNEDDSEIDVKRGSDLQFVTGNVRFSFSFSTAVCRVFFTVVVVAAVKKNIWKLIIFNGANGVCCIERRWYVYNIKMFIQAYRIFTKVHW